MEITWYLTNEALERARANREPGDDVIVWRQQDDGSWQAFDGKGNRLDNGKPFEIDGRLFDPEYPGNSKPADWTYI